MPVIYTDKISSNGIYSPHIESMRYQVDSKHLEQQVQRDENSRPLKHPTRMLHNLLHSSNESFLGRVRTVVNFGKHVNWEFLLR